MFRDEALRILAAATDASLPTYPPRHEPVSIGNVEEAYDTLVRLLTEAEKLADARLELLREHYGYVRTEDGIQVPGKVTRCLSPAKYGTDCGHCIRCRSIYSNGALNSGTCTTCGKPWEHHFSINPARPWLQARLEADHEPVPVTA